MKTIFLCWYFLSCLDGQDFRSHCDIVHFPLACACYFVFLTKSTFGIRLSYWFVDIGISVVLVLPCGYVLSWHTIGRWFNPPPLFPQIQTSSHPAEFGVFHPMMVSYLEIAGTVTCLDLHEILSCGFNFSPYQDNTLHPFFVFFVIWHLYVLFLANERTDC